MSNSTITLNASALAAVADASAALLGKSHAWRCIALAVKSAHADGAALADAVGAVCDAVAATLARVTAHPSAKRGAGKTLSNYRSALASCATLGVEYLTATGEPLAYGRIVAALKEARGEGDAPASGEGDAPASGEGDAPASGEGDAEARIAALMGECDILRAERDAERDALAAAVAERDAAIAERDAAHAALAVMTAERDALAAALAAMTAERDALAAAAAAAAAAAKASAVESKKRARRVALAA